MCLCVRVFVLPNVTIECQRHKTCVCVTFESPPLCPAVNLNTTISSHHRAVQTYFKKLVIWEALETKNDAGRAVFSLQSLSVYFLSVWIRHDMDICVVEVREEGLEDAGVCVFLQIEKELGYD